MPRLEFHEKPFDESTLTKLRIFELYAREWIPVFLAPKDPLYKQMHIFDFFAGPGTDSTGKLGSPLRLFQKLREYENQPGRSKVRIHLHFYDKSEEKIRCLTENIQTQGLSTDVAMDLRALEFNTAFGESRSILSEPNAAKLLFLDHTDF